MIGDYEITDEEEDLPDPKEGLLTVEVRSCNFTNIHGVAPFSNAIFQASTFTDGAQASTPPELMVKAAALAIQQRANPIHIDRCFFYMYVFCSK